MQRWICIGSDITGVVREPFELSVHHWIKIRLQSVPSLRRNSGSWVGNASLHEFDVVELRS